MFWAFGILGALLLLNVAWLFLGVNSRDGDDWVSHAEDGWAGLPMCEGGRAA